MPRIRYVRLTSGSSSDEEEDERDPGFLPNLNQNHPRKKIKLEKLSSPPHRPTTYVFPSHVGPSTSQNQTGQSSSQVAQSCLQIGNRHDNMDMIQTGIPQPQIKPKNIIRIIADADSNGFSRISRNFRCSGLYPIGFQIDNSLQTYRMAEIVVKVNASEDTEGLGGCFNRNTVMQKFPGLVNIQIQIEREGTDLTNAIQFVTEKELNENEEKEMKVYESLIRKKEIKPQKFTFILVKHFSYKFDNMEVPPELFQTRGKSQIMKIFPLEFARYDSIHNEFTINVNLCSMAIVGDPSYIKFIVPKTKETVVPIFNYFLNLGSKKNPVTHPSLFKDDTERLFSMAKEFHKYETLPDPDFPIQHRGLIKIKLLNFQRKTIQWMLKREGAAGLGTENTTEDFDCLKNLLQRKMYLPIPLKQERKKSRQGYYCETSGEVSWNREPISALPSGGILAEEMGLGKTIEVLSLILLNRRPNFEYNVEEDVNESESGSDSESGLEGQRRRSQEPTTLTSDEHLFFSALELERVPKSKTPPEQVNQKMEVDYPNFECRCGLSYRNRDDKKIVTCTACETSHHAICFGYDPVSLSKVEDNYLCPLCISGMPPLPAKSTLIVVPATILEQWADEIVNNVYPNHLSYFIYCGVTKANYQPPAVLSTYDIVLTTYEILRTEIYYSELPSEEVYARRFRNPRRYVSLPSPLVSVGWWRVCLDEAQMVKHVNSCMSRMAHRVPAVHRWCITGTPIMHNLQDLYGLITFLGVEPICSEICWDALIMDPFRRNDTEIISKIFGQIFWRTEKKDVENQMKLPRQTEVIHRLEFSPVESFSYKDRCRHWSAELEKSLKIWAEPDMLEQKISQNKQALIPLTKLREFCSHPQLEEGVVDVFIEDHAFLTLTVRELSRGLLCKTRKLCWENYMELVTALNTAAGLQMLGKEWRNAAKKYKRILTLAETFKDDFNTQDIERLHALTNLAELIEKDYDRDGNYGTGVYALALRGDRIKLKDMLLKKHSAAVATISSRIVSLNLKVVKYVTELDGGWDDPMESRESKLLVQWWVKILKSVLGTGTDGGVEAFQKLVNRIQRTITISIYGEYFEVETGCRYIANVFDTMLTLRDALQEGIVEINNSRNELFTEWLSIDSEDPNETVEYAAKCHLYENQTLEKPPPCRLCAFLKKLERLESVIHRSYLTESHHPRKPKNRTADADGLKTPEVRERGRVTNCDKSTTESILNEILKFGQNYSSELELDKGRVHMDLFKVMKEQCEYIQTWLIKKGDEILALDAINQACMPLVLGISNDTSTQTPLPNRKLIKPDQLVELTAQELLKSIETRSDFEKSISKYRYLQMLEKYEHGRIGYMNQDSCACFNLLDQKWGFLPCGHCICSDCGDIEEIEFSVCTECESEFNFSDILFVDTNSPRHTVTNISHWKIDSSDLWDSGNRDPFSKVEAVVRTLMTLKARAEELKEAIPKALVVSSWQPMLEVIGHELFQNKISYMTYREGASNGKSLTKFRTNDKQALLMPLYMASTGLTEATHILLVEPILNTSWEQHAIGRIHRLGQKKQTYVHRFYTTIVFGCTVRWKEWMNHPDFIKIHSKFLIFLRWPEQLKKKFIRDDKATRNLKRET